MNQEQSFGAHFGTAEGQRDSLAADLAKAKANAGHYGQQSAHGAEEAAKEAARQYYLDVDRVMQNARAPWNSQDGHGSGPISDAPLGDRLQAILASQLDTRLMLEAAIVRHTGEGEGPKDSRTEPKSNTEGCFPINQLVAENTRLADVNSRLATRLLKLL